MTTRRANKTYFEREPGAPAPLRLKVERRVRFNEVDPMGIVWFGRYPLFLEEGAAELGRQCGLSYQDYIQAGLMAPVASVHMDYLVPLYLDESFSIVTSLVWTDGARLNTEYELVKADGTTAARACTVQVFITAAERRVCLIPPPLLEQCRHRWKSGALKELQA